MQVENFEVFEAIRKKTKGGTIIGAYKALQPCLIQVYSSRYKVSSPTTWELGAGAIPFFIQTKLGFSGRAPVFKIYTNPIKLK